MESLVLVHTSETCSAKETLKSLLTFGDVLECDRVPYKEFKNYVEFDRPGERSPE